MLLLIISENALVDFIHYLYRDGAEIIVNRDVKSLTELLRVNLSRNLQLGIGLALFLNPFLSRLFINAFRVQDVWVARHSDVQVLGFPKPLELLNIANF